MTIERRHRLRGTITSFSYKRDMDHDTWICSVGIVFDGYGSHSFGDLCLDNDGSGPDGAATGPDFIADLCKLFHVEAPEKLVGLGCYGLWSHGWFSSPIVGLENLDGERFTIQGWRRKHWPETPPLLDEMIAN
jgi:hypothetical protein